MLAKGSRPAHRLANSFARKCIMFEKENTVRHRPSKPSRSACQRHGARALNCNRPASKPRQQRLVNKRHAIVAVPRAEGNHPAGVRQRLLRH